ncbi:two-component sensor histidine kinase [Crocosphaera subtropica ATCC 51142]|uniref:histidine kinase n=1 Tax=Crocosphaera subtropica (strain ATCC 51142 / BH68) TaxID=43989 RepID=B1WYW3_CROS5|nr:HAMP domain-containing sensor histidine kinase [Crocosphaera subtropica]ACB52727.1 two-component sensor histidine kinase [Crocosphaera subtropica ATCC 51142]
MFQNVRFRLLLFYLLVMEGILILFGGSIYFSFTRQESKQLDNKLMALAEVVAPTFSKIQYQDTSSLQQLHNEDLFDPETQTIEWFDHNKNLLWHQGNLQVSAQPEPGLFTLGSQKHSSGIRSVTFSVAVNASRNMQASSRGYVRISQSLEELEASQNQLRLILSLSAIAAFSLAAVGGYFLTDTAVKPIEEAFEKQQQFTADASHELRGPLTAIKASIDIMRRHPERFQEKDVRKVGAIANATAQMTRLVEDLLFLARTEKKTIKSNPEYIPISLNDLLQKLIDLLEPLAGEKNITLNYQAFDEVSVMGNPDQLTRLFSNLLYNALNYTSEKGLVLIRLIQHNRLVKVAVEDTGVGIAPEDVSHVFDRFWRADKSRHNSGGTGLGLSIAQAIAHSHQGKITVKSKLGIGTCFEVSLPILENK